MSHTTPRSRRTPLVLLLLAVVALLAGCTSSDAAEIGGTQTLEVDGRERTYELEPAKGLAKGEKAAVVVVLHQEGGTPDGVKDETELAGLTEQGATLVYPAGVDASWDAGKCCGEASKQGVDDVAFLKAVFADVARKTPVDLERSALVGYSSGGMLAYRYVCNAPGTLAAAVVVSGSLEDSCSSGIEVPDVLTLHGKKDGTIGLEQSTFVAALGLAPKPVNKTLKEITTSAGCGAPVLSNEPDAEVYRWTGCRGGEVVARIVADEGHGWGKLGASEQTAAFLRDQLLEG